MIDTNGVVQDHLVYTAFGQIYSESNASIGHWQDFAFQHLDSNTGMGFDGKRVYNASLGDFMQQDPRGFAAGDANQSRYVGNDVTNAVDPSGLQRRGLIPLPPRNPRAAPMPLIFIPFNSPNGGVQIIPAEQWYYMREAFNHHEQAKKYTALALEEEAEVNAMVTRQRQIALTMALHYGVEPRGSDFQIYLQFEIRYRNLFAPDPVQELQAQYEAAGQQGMQAETLRQWLKAEAEYHWQKMQEAQAMLEALEQAPGP